VHGTKHRWERLRWICDVAELIRVREDVKWETLMRVAESLGSRHMLSLGLYLAHDVLGAPLPEQAFTVGYVLGPVKEFSVTVCIARRARWLRNGYEGHRACSTIPENV